MHVDYFTTPCKPPRLHRRMTCNKSWEKFLFVFVLKTCKTSRNLAVSSSADMRRPVCWGYVASRVTETCQKQSSIYAGTEKLCNREVCIVYKESRRFRNYIYVRRHKITVTKLRNSSRLEWHIKEAILASLNFYIYQESSFRKIFVSPCLISLRYKWVSVPLRRSVSMFLIQNVGM